MPRINNNEQRNTAALEDNFMNPASPAYRTVSSFRKSLERLADTLAADAQSAGLGRELKRYARAVEVLQLGDDAYKKEQVEKAISDVALDLGPFLTAGEKKANYLAIAEAGEKTGLLSREKLDEGLALIGDAMGVELVPEEQELQRETQPEVQSEVQSEAQPEVQPEARPEPEPEIQPRSYDDAPLGALGMQMMDSVKNGGPAALALDQMIRQLEDSPRKEEAEVEAVLSTAKEFQNACSRQLGDMEEKEKIDDYFIPGTSALNLRRQLKTLETKDPALCEQLCGPFLRTMRETDFSQEEARYRAISQENNRAYEENRQREKAIQREADARKVRLYAGDVELTENSIAHFIDNVRNEIVNSPGFRKEPPEIDPRQLATLQMLMTSVGEKGETHTAKNPEHLANMQPVIDLQMANNGKFFQELAKDPKIVQIMTEREPGKCWFDSSGDSFMAELEAFDRRYEPNRQAENIGQARKTVDAALETFHTEAGYLAEAGNPYIQALADAAFKVQKANGHSKSRDNLALRDIGMQFLGSLRAEDLRDTEGAKECAAAALSAMGVLLPPEDVQKGCDILNGKLGLGPCDRDYCAADKFLPGFEQGETALTYIDNCKRGIVDDDTARQEAARIFAARMAVDTAGGRASYLRKPLSKMQAALAAEDLNKNGNFRDWLKTLGKDKARALLSGHGGDLEKDFRNYLRQVPPGKLENDPALKRYLPTARERIESLQEQVKRAGRATPALTKEKLTELRTAAAAEIIAIRNACRVERKTGYGLDKPIPPAAPGQRTVAQTAELLCGNDAMKNLLDAEAVKSLGDGHGGRMLAEVRRQYNGQQREDEIAGIINENTVGARKRKLGKEAEALQEKLKSANKAEQEAALKQSRRLLGEFIHLNRLSGNQMQGDVPWKAGEAAAASGERSRLIRTIIENPADAERAMNSVSTGNNGVFSQLLFDKKNEGKLRDADIRPQVQEEKRHFQMNQQDRSPDHGVIPGQG